MYAYRMYEFDCCAYDGAIYCNTCLPEGLTTESEEVTPVFAEEEVDFYPVCDSCGTEHDYMSLTSAGMVHRDVNNLVSHFAAYADPYDLRISASFAFAAWAQDHYNGMFDYRYCAATVLEVNFGPMGSNWIHTEQGLESDMYNWLCSEEGCEHEEEESTDLED